MTTQADGRAGAVSTSSPAEATGGRYVYDLSEGNAGMRVLLGGKGAGVAEMMRIGVPVPDGFTVTTSACVATMRNDGAWPDGLWDEIQAHLDALERRTGRTLGAADRPLLVSVRSGAVRSMPGMMDTILNLGISDAAAEGLAAESGDPRFAWDSYRRFVQMYGEVVEGVPGQVFEDELTALKERRGVTQDTELTAEDLKELVATFRSAALRGTGHDLPTDPREQLRRSVDAVFGSWNSPRAPP
jgi:pyruvate,orthophosphate dikinase